MEEGIILKNYGSAFGVDKFSEVLYGFNNRYGAICKVIQGGPLATKVGDNPEKDIIELHIVGLTVAPEDIFDVSKNHFKYIYHELDEQNYHKVLEAFKTDGAQEWIDKEIGDKYNESSKLFEMLDHDQMVHILQTIHKLKEREIDKTIPLQLKPHILLKSKDKYLFASNEMTK